MDFNKNQLIAAIAVSVHAEADNRHVFAATQQLLGEYRREQSAALAKLVYKASRVKAKPARIKALAKGFQVLSKRRDSVLEAINTSRSVYGFSKYTLTELGVWSCAMDTGIAGAPVWTAIDTVTDLMNVLRHDQKQMDLLLAWGRTQAHGSEAKAAAALVSPRMLAVWEQSLLAIGAAVQKKGKETVPFKDGVAMEWAVDGYEAVVNGGKDGAVLRGVSDAVRASINAAYFSHRNATNRDNYQLAGVVSGHRSAYFALNPDQGNGGRVHVAKDADVGQEDYAGADDVVVQIGTRLVNLGNHPGEAAMSEAFSAYDQWHLAQAETLLADAQLVMSQLTCGIKFDGLAFDGFADLKAAIWESLAARGKERKEAAEASKELQQAKLVVQVASQMDAVSRRVFQATQKHLPLAEAALLLKEEALAQATRKAKALAKAEVEMAAAMKIAAKEAAYSATAEREKEREKGAAARKRAAAAAARRESTLDRELALKKAVANSYEFTPVEREMPTVAQYRESLHKAVFA